MTIVSDDPSLWPLISVEITTSYVSVIFFAAVVYDWALTFGQEIELIWRQSWSLMTTLYLSVRYLGLVYPLTVMLPILPAVSVTDLGCTIYSYAGALIPVIVNAMLGVITIARLHAMHQRSRKILIFLIAVYAPVTIACVAISVILSSYISGEELVLSGTYQCIYVGKNPPLLTVATWVLGVVWEVLALCLAVWVAVQHFREVQRPSTGWAVGNLFRVLVRTHVFYFAAFVAVSCFVLGGESPTLNSLSLGATVYFAFLQIVMALQMFVLGPRLILGVREYHAKLMAESDAEIDMRSIAFQERVHISTGGGV